MSTGIQSFVADFATLEQRLNGGARSWVHGLRQGALRDLQAGDMPSAKLEGWRYTSLKALSETTFRTAFATRPGPGAEALTRLGLGEVPGLQSTVVDGAYHAAPTPSALPAGVIVGSLAQAWRDHQGLVEPWLGRLSAELEQETFVTLNTALLGDGAFVYVPAGVRLAEPLHLGYVATVAAGTMIHPRALVVLGPGAEATLLESWAHAPGAGGYLSNAVTEIALGANAQLRHVRLQAEADDAHHLAGLVVRQERDSRYAAHLVSTGGKLGRTAVRIVLGGDGAEADLDSLGLASGRQHVDLVSTIVHAEPHGTSRERVKNVLGGDATSSFYGRVLVRPGARGTAATQHNHNLLLSPRAVANTRPQLEIHHDDIKAAHGATVGQLDPDQLFYLRARGIGLDEARRQLTLGFAREVLDAIPEAAGRAALAARVQRHVEAGL